MNCPVFVLIVMSDQWSVEPERVAKQAEGSDNLSPG